jgi:hypothetical protein
MTNPDNTAGPSGRGRLLRWCISSATLGVPQAGGPVAFAFVAIGLTGDARGGAAMILAMTVAQVIGAIPITRLGRTLPTAAFLRLLLALRTAALVAIGLGAAHGVPFAWLIGLAALSGLVNGAAFGLLRAMLSQLVPSSQLPRALGIAATLNETTFVLAPVAASGLGTLSPVLAVLVLAAVGAAPALLVPSLQAAPVPATHKAEGSVLNRSVLPWLICAAAGGATVAAIEIGAVALALSFGYEPALAILFTVPLCLSSVAGGIWVSVRNRMPTRRVVLAQLSLMVLGAGLAALGLSVATTVVATVLIGAVLAPLSTYYSLVLDTLAPPHRRAELFALLRTAHALGVILSSAVLAATSPSVTLIAVTGLMTFALLVVGLSQRAR